MQDTSSADEAAKERKRLADEELRAKLKAELEAEMRAKAEVEADAALQEVRAATALPQILPARLTAAPRRSAVGRVAVDAQDAGLRRARLL